MSLERALLAVLIPLLMFAASARADEDLTDLDLATLMTMDVTVTSAARREQSIAQSAAAVFVITREDIRRSGATNLPDILRMAPGMQVGRVNTRSWAVAARGFNHRFANKLLVMVDGRSIYTSAFSGVMWEEQPVALDEIERIEIVRGPGGALWGVNAVNGVVNIITRSAKYSHGLAAHAGGGSEPAYTGGVRAGGESRFGDYRAYLERTHIDGLRASDSEWGRTVAGVRVDQAAGRGVLTLQADAHRGNFGAPDGPEEIGLSHEVRTGGLLASWTSDYERGRLDLRSSHSVVDRAGPIEWNEAATTFEAQFAAAPIGRHILTLGVGLRRTSDDQKGSRSNFTITESAETDWSVYGQDEVSFFGGRMRGTLGAKVESTASTGAAVQPTARLLWDPSARHTLWTAFSRAQRAPSRFDRHSVLHLPYPVSLAPPLPTEVVVTGSADLDAETLEAFEAGWRFRPSADASLDLAVYRNEYEHLILMRTLPPTVRMAPIPHLEVPIVFTNAAEARTQGAELTAEWAPRKWLRFQSFASWYDLRDWSMRPDVAQTLGSQDVERVLSLRARFDLPHDAELDLAWRNVSASLDGRIPSYDSVNLRLAWLPTESLELSLTIDNLFDDAHIETDDFINSSLGVEIGRSAFARITWRPSR